MAYQMVGHLLSNTLRDAPRALQSGLDKHPESEFDLSSGLWFSKPLDKYPESEFDLSSGLESEFS